MLSISHRIVWIIPAIVGAMLLVGCNEGGHRSVAADGGNRAVMCSKCQTVWVDRPDPMTHKGFIAYHATRAKIMTCPDCESAVVNFFKTGKLEHTCKTCGEELTQCVH